MKQNNNIIVIPPKESKQEPFSFYQELGSENPFLFLSNFYLISTSHIKYNSELKSYEINLKEQKRCNFVKVTNINTKEDEYYYITYKNKKNNLKSSIAVRHQVSDTSINPINPNEFQINDQKTSKIRQKINFNEKILKFSFFADSSYEQKIVEVANKLHVPLNLVNFLPKDQELDEIPFNTYMFKIELFQLNRKITEMIVTNRNWTVSNIKNLYIDQNGLQKVRRKIKFFNKNQKICDSEPLFQFANDRIQIKTEIEVTFYFNFQKFSRLSLFCPVNRPFSEIQRKLKSVIQNSDDMSLFYDRNDQRIQILNENTIESIGFPHEIIVTRDEDRNEFLNDSKTVVLKKLLYYIFVDMWKNMFRFLFNKLDVEDGDEIDENEENQEEEENHEIDNDENQKEEKYDILVEEEEEDKNHEINDDDDDDGENLAEKEENQKELKQNGFVNGDEIVDQNPSNFNDKENIIDYQIEEEEVDDGAEEIKTIENDGHIENEEEESIVDHDEKEGILIINQRQNDFVNEEEEINDSHSDDVVTEKETMTNQHQNSIDKEEEEENSKETISPLNQNEKEEREREELERKEREEEIANQQHNLVEEEEIDDQQPDDFIDFNKTIMKKKQQQSDFHEKELTDELPKELTDELPKDFNEEETVLNQHQDFDDKEKTQDSNLHDIVDDEESVLHQQQIFVEEEEEDLLDHQTNDFHEKEKTSNHQTSDFHEKEKTSKHHQEDFHEKETIANHPQIEIEEEEEEQSDDQTNDFHKDEKTSDKQTKDLNDEEESIVNQNPDFNKHFYSDDFVDKNHKKETTGNKQQILTNNDDDDETEDQQSNISNEKKANVEEDLTNHSYDLIDSDDERILDHQQNDLDEKETMTNHLSYEIEEEEEEKSDEQTNDFHEDEKTSVKNQKDLDEKESISDHLPKDSDEKETITDDHPPFEAKEEEEERSDEVQNNFAKKETISTPLHQEDIETKIAFKSPMPDPDKETHSKNESNSDDEDDKESTKDTITQMTTSSTKKNGTIIIRPKIKSIQKPVEVISEFPSNLCELRVRYNDEMKPFLFPRDVTVKSIKRRIAAAFEIPLNRSNINIVLKNENENDNDNDDDDDSIELKDNKNIGFYCKEKSIPLVLEITENKHKKANIINIQIYGFEKIESFNLSEKMTVAELKEQIKQNIEDVEDIFIIYGGTNIPDDVYVENLNINNPAILQCCINNDIFDFTKFDEV